MTRMPASVLLRCFLRTYLVSAAYNTRGLQNVGLMYALDPGLKAIHTTPEALDRARERYLFFYNCNPFWSSFLVGAFLFMESAPADSPVNSPEFSNLRDVTSNTLSALGDSFFNGSLMVTWALIASVCFTLGAPGITLALTALFFLALQSFRVYTFLAGFRSGFSLLHQIKQWDLINLGDALKVLNAFLVVLFLALTLRPDQHPRVWLAGMVLLLPGAWLAGRVHFSRIVLALGVLGAGLCLPASAFDGIF